MKTKRREGHGWTSLPKFLFNIFLGIPFILIVLVFALIQFIILLPYYVVTKFCIKKKSSSIKIDAINISEVSDKLDSSLLNAPKKYDLVLYGSTGYTGKLAAQYVAEQYGMKFKWAISGRNQKALQAVKDSLILINEDCKNVDILVADSKDIIGLAKIVLSTKVVCSTAGPFSKFGSNLVGLCANYGTDYCDITGEVGWVRRMIDLYDNIAHKNGSRIVSCCGLDSVPWDLLAFVSAEQLKKKNSSEKVKSIDFFDDMPFLPSGGTVNTLFTSLSTPVNKANSLGFDPIVKIPGSNEKSEIKYKANLQSKLSFNKVCKKWVGAWALAQGNSLIVKRSNAILNYGNMNYYEGYTYPNFMAGFNQYFEFVLQGVFYTFFLTKWILRNYILPKPGQGPTEKQLMDGFFRLTALCKGDQGSVVENTLSYVRDAGYKDTGRMLVEAGLSLSLNGNEIKVKGGYLTPAACQGEVYLRRLIETGCLLETKEQKAKSS